MTKRKQAGGPEVAVRNTKKRERQIQEEKRKQVKQAAFDQKLARMLSALQVEKSEAASATDPQAKKKKPTGYHNLDCTDLPSDRQPKGCDLDQKTSIGMCPCGSQREFCAKGECFSLECPNRRDEDPGNIESFEFCECCEGWLCPEHAPSDCDDCGGNTCEDLHCPHCKRHLCWRCNDDHDCDDSACNDECQRQEREDWELAQSSCQPFY